MTLLALTTTGLIDTTMLQDAFALSAQANRDAAESAIPNGRLATAEDVAKIVLYVASDESAYSTGAEFVVDGGITAAYVTPE